MKTRQTHSPPSKMKKKRYQEEKQNIRRWSAFPPLLWTVTQIYTLEIEEGKQYPGLTLKLSRGLCWHRHLGGRAGLVVRALAFHQCDPGSISTLGTKCGLSLLVLYSVLRGFSPGNSVLLSCQKPAFDLIWFVKQW